MPHKRGFSLIELLVVIAIIAILAAILFPVFNRAKEAAKKAVCLTHARQLGMTVMMYAESHSGGLPMSANYGVPTNDPYRIWVAQVYPYVQNRAVFVCPSSDGKFGSTWAERGKLTIGYTTVSAYDPQGCIENDPNNQHCEGFTTIANMHAISEPSRTALFADTPGGEIAAKYRGHTFSPYNGIRNHNDWRLSLPLISDRDLVRELNHLPPANLKPVYCRHQQTGRDDGFANIIFADGHAKGHSARSMLAMEKGADIIWRFR